MRSWVRRSFQVLRAQFQSVNSLTDGQRPRMGLPFIDIQQQNQLFISLGKEQDMKQIFTSIYRQARMGTVFNRWTFCSAKQGHGLIGSMNEVAQGDRYYQEKNVAQAAVYYQKSLQILPIYIKGDDSYNTELEAVASRLAKCYAWKGDLKGVQAITSKLIQAAIRDQIQCGTQVKLLSDVLNILGRVQAPINQQRNLIIRERFGAVLQKFLGKDSEIAQQLTKSTKSEQKNTENLQGYIHGQLRSTSAFLFSSLLLYPNFPTNESYNKLCNTLLKTAQKSSQKNVIKPLLLLVSNLLRNKQYLQAQGMLQYCLDRKKQNLKPILLKTNQEYALLNLLLAATFDGVDRIEQSRRIRQEFNGKFDINLFMAQHYLLDSI